MLEFWFLSWKDFVLTRKVLFGLDPDGISFRWRTTKPIRLRTVDRRTGTREGRFSGVRVVDVRQQVWTESCDTVAVDATLPRPLVADRACHQRRAQPVLIRRLHTRWHSRVIADLSNILIINSIQSVNHSVSYLRTRYAGVVIFLLSVYLSPQENEKLLTGNWCNFLVSMCYGESYNWSHFGDIWAWSYLESIFSLSYGGI